jgi:hypothetical protein
VPQCPGWCFFSLFLVLGIKLSMHANTCYTIELHPKPSLRFWFAFHNSSEHLFICLSAIFMSLEKSLFESFAHFKTELLVFLLLNCKGSFCFVFVFQCSGPASTLPLSYISRP